MHGPTHTGVASLHQEFGCNTIASKSLSFGPSFQPKRNGKNLAEYCSTVYVNKMWPCILKNNVAIEVKMFLHKTETLQTDC